MERIQRTIGEVLGDHTWPELSPTASVQAAVDAMAREGTDCVLVIEDGKVVGVFTARDFLNRVVGDNRLPAEVNLGQVMTRDPVILRRDHCITYAINCMATRNIRNVPVVDDEGRAVGLLRIWDVVAHLSELFEEIAALPPLSPHDDMWVDLGGG
ncbi:MAG TPA: CBS domain-containing protein [Kofleriaceae bacterium]|nr:CBS domain-containing protein [Kofleriaceae bacterium]